MAMCNRLGRTSLKSTLQHNIRRATSSTSKMQKLNELNSKALTIELSDNLKPKSPYHELLFGKEWTDHLLEIDWTVQYGWDDPKIRPYAPFQVDPASSSFQYSLAAFDGTKAYLDDNDRIRLFRPDKNMQRLNSSCEALCFPAIDSGELMHCISELVKLERSWIPNQYGYSLYIRPTIISTTASIMVQPAQSLKLYTILSPVGPYYPDGFKPVSLLATDKYVRAWPGGVGDKKLGSNYGPTIKPQVEAAAKGYSQIMWLLPQNMKSGDMSSDASNVEYIVSEVGTMNQFFFWRNKDGEEELVTAPLDGTILPGVTRDCVLELVRDWNRFKVTERYFTMSDVIEAIEENRMMESFGAGTAAVIAPVNKIGWKGKDYVIPLDTNDPNAGAGPLAKELFDTILDIQYGKRQYKDWSVVIPE